jgi:hypothetical protein
MESIAHVFVELKALDNKKQLFGKLSLDERLIKKDDLFLLNSQISDKWEKCRSTYIHLDHKSRQSVKDYKISNSYLVLFQKLDREFPLKIDSGDLINQVQDQFDLSLSTSLSNKFKQIVDLIDNWIITYNDENKDKLFQSLVKIIFRKNYFYKSVFNNSRIVLNLLRIIRELKITHNLNQNLIYRGSIINICKFFPSLIFEDKTEYHGEFSNEVLHGFGVLIEKKYNDIYIGEFEENNCSGFGLKVFENGDFYFGEFMNDLLHGYGRYTWADGDSYIGFWIEGKQNETLDATIDLEKEGFELDKHQFITNLPSFDFMIEKFNITHVTNFKILETNNERLNNLIQLITIDNRISQVEKRFLIEKTRELNLSIELLKEAQDYLETNNPFLDKIFELVFNDGIINKNELEFIHEKTIEFGLIQDIVNDRFWSYAIHFHLNDLLKINEFKEWVFTWYVYDNFSMSKNKVPFNPKIWLDIFSGTDFAQIIRENCQKIKEKNINEIGIQISFEEFIRHQNLLIYDTKIDLSSISLLHRDALCWFAINKNNTINYIDVSGEKQFNNGKIYLFNSAKGIHKPRSESYVLSIKVLLDSSYNDKIEEKEGSWDLKYHKEDGNEWTNEGLIKCMENKVPIGLFYQIKSPPAPIYRVYGLGIIHSYDGTYFSISEIKECDYNIFNWNPELKDKVSTEPKKMSINELDLSNDNIFLKFSKVEQDQILSLLKSMEYLPASNNFLEYSFKYDLKDYKKINKHFDELESTLN